MVIAAPWRQEMRLREREEGKPHKAEVRDAHCQQLSLLCQLISSSLPVKMYLPLTAAFAF